MKASFLVRGGGWRRGGSIPRVGVFFFLILMEVQFVLANLKAL